MAYRLERHFVGLLRSYGAAHNRRMAGADATSLAAVRLQKDVALPEITWLATSDTMPDNEAQPVSEITMLPSTQIIFLPASLLRAGTESYEFVASVDNHVINMLVDGAYELHELPGNAVVFLAASTYYGEVMNGGHSQFLFNCFHALEADVPNAMTAFASMGAGQHLEILAAFRDWATTRGILGPAKSGYPALTADDDVFLGSLDDSLYEVERHPIFHDLSAAWVQTWDNVRFVEDEKLEAMRSAQIALNPNMVPRMAMRRMLRFRDALTEEFFIGLSLAVTSIDGKEILLGIRNGQGMEVDDVEVMTWHLETTAGYRLGQHENGESEVFAAPGGVGADPAASDMLRYPIGKANGSTIRIFTEYDRAQAVAVAADMFLGQYHPAGADEAALRPFSVNAGRPIYVLAAEGAYYLILATSDGVEVRALQDQAPILFIAFSEIDAYSAEVEMLATDTGGLAVVH